MNQLQIGEMAQLTGVSIRTLRHYDEIGLLRPQAVTVSGYRLYGEADVKRMQHIRFYRELGFPLEEIRGILDHPSFNRKEALGSHLHLLEEKKKQLERMIAMVRDTLLQEDEDEQGGEWEMDKVKGFFEAFDMEEIEKHQARYAEETREKYGKSDAWAESERRTASYGAAEWAAIMEGWGRLYRTLAERMQAGAAPDDEVVQQAVAGLRQHITDHFYTCTVEIFRGLGEMYVDRQGKVT